MISLLEEALMSMLKAKKIISSHMRSSLENGVTALVEHWAEELSWFWIDLSALEQAVALMILITNGIFLKTVAINGLVI